ncbi:MAG: CRISPR system precrRNA processing endoribonuclease RAMP protein Cas6 [Phototrophicaceae bacterium]
MTTPFLFLNGLEVHQLIFHVQATSYLSFGPQAGAQLRGALWEKLKVSLGDTDLLGQLMVLEIPNRKRGSNPPRPFSIRPPLGERPSADRHYSIGDAFSFTISLFGKVAELFPYIIQAVYQIGLDGVGYGRGRYQLIRVEAHNPITGTSADLVANGRLVASPSVPITADQVAAFVRGLPRHHIRLRFLTPTQLIQGERSLAIPEFVVLIARLLERCQAIEAHYTTEPESSDAWREEHLRLTIGMRDVSIAQCNTRWVDVRSNSQRDNSTKKLSGFVGQVVYSGLLENYLRWLVWGQLVQVGKNTVKGNGWYEIVT